MPKSRDRSLEQTRTGPFYRRVRRTADGARDETILGPGVARVLLGTLAGLGLGLLTLAGVLSPEALVQLLRLLVR